MSRTLKDAPFRVRAARTPGAVDVHFGCEDAPPGRDVVFVGWRDETVTEPARWRPRARHVTYDARTPVFDDDGTFAGFLIETEGKDVTDWVLEPVTDTVRVRVVGTLPCRLRVANSRSRCRQELPASARRRGRPTGLYKSRAGRAPDRDELRALAREYNTHRDFAGDDTPPPPGPSAGGCRYGCCWW